MKKLITIAVTLLCVLSCKDNPVVKKAKEVKQAATNSNKLINEAAKMQDDIKDLTETTPLTNDELKAWLPNDVHGMKRTAFKTGAMGMMNIASVEASYATEDKEKTVKIEVIDGAGEMGAYATASLRLIFSQDFEEESEDKLRKTVTKNGTKAIEEYNKRRNKSVIQLFQDKRFYIKATGEGMEIDELWKLVDDMNIKDLG
ncbi:hypothetical protein U1E44_15565 [Arenibacter sp. GZD96]|uniref:hypothetical protein n=1 Tax=Aurantibrevibacter litoralis TaxID=3106030 RepID=UPI002AFEABFF|nr:hypothetical protein [Arenibacter sp. GZD-96]MEA1787519.1 hypothetical protein [Arenibacter sp. GZD-96]